MVLGVGRGVGELVFNGCGGSVWEKEKVPEMIMVMAAQQCECA